MRPYSLIRFVAMVCLTVMAGLPAYAVTNKISANFSSGSVLVGPNSNTCNTGIQGALRYMSSGPSLAFCDGVTSGWTALGGGSGAAGSNTQVQFNSSGVIGASSNFTWDLTNKILNLANSGTGAARAGNGTVSLPSHAFNTVASGPSMTMSTRTGTEDVYLSTMGVTDWAYWYGPTGTPTQRKSGGGSLIGVATKTNGGTFNTYDYGDKTIYWTDGTPTASDYDSHGLQVYLNSATVPLGIDVTYPADTNLREARLYFGWSNSAMRVTAIMSDGSTANIVDNSLRALPDSARNEGIATVVYAAASAGQTLTIRIETTTWLNGSQFPTPYIFAATVKTLSSTAGAATGLFMANAGTSLDLAVGGVQALRLGNVASGVNYFRIIPSVLGASPTLTNVGSDTAGNGLGINLTARSATASGTGGPINLSGPGAGGGAGTGGSVFTSAGNGGTTGAGGAATITAANGGATSGNGGSIVINGGDIGGAGTGVQGTIYFKIGSANYMTIKPPATGAATIMSSTAAATIPSGAQPSTPVNGMIHYNTGTSKLEGRQNGAWANLVVSGSAALSSLSDIKLNYTSSGNSQTSLYFGRTAALPATGDYGVVSMGAGAMGARTGGSEAVAFGALAMSSATSASVRTHMGAYAGGTGPLDDNANGNSTSLGAHALYAARCGAENLAVGSYALASYWYSTDCRFTAVGYQAGQNVKQIGDNGGNPTGMDLFGSQVMAQGFTAGGGSYNVVFGAGSANGATMKPDWLTYVGAEIGDSSYTATSYAVIAGAQAYTAPGLTDAATGTAALGKGAAAGITTGDDNAFAGYQAGITTTTGSTNTMIGSGINASTATISNEISLGNVWRATRASGLLWKYDANQHINYQGSLPTISSCGTGAARVGNDNVLKVTTGTSVGACTITFTGRAFVNVPICTVTAGTSGVLNAYISAASTTAITVSWSPNAASQVLYIMCRGYL